MMKNRLKICRVTDLDSAKILVWLGVDYLGLHLIDESQLSLIQIFRLINTELQNKLSFYNSVLVTKIKDLILLRKLITEGGFKFLQIHTHLEERELIPIRELCSQLSIKLILVFDPRICRFDSRLNKLSDIILIDNIKGGTGKAINYENLDIKDFSKALLAGGINNLNISELKNKYSPLGFDVQTYTEYSKGVKNFENVFILKSILTPDSYRVDISPRTNILSLSLTDIKENDYDQKINPLISHIDCFHLDHSTGYFSKDFIRNSLTIAKMLNSKAPQKPYDLHVFAIGKDAANIIDMYLKTNFRLHTVYFHVEHLTLDVFNEIRKLKEYCNKSRIKLGVALQAGVIDIQRLRKFLCKIHNLNICELSIVGPSKSKNIESYKTLVLPLGQELNILNKEFNNAFSFAIDRETSPNKIKTISCLKFNRIFSGKSIIEAKNPLKVIDDFNKIFGM